MIVVSNWDVSLPGALASAGLSGLIDAVVTSAEVGAAKPDPEIFTRALAMAGVAAEPAVHVGDSLAEDVAGARACRGRAATRARAHRPTARLRRSRPAVPAIASSASWATPA